MISAVSFLRQELLHADTMKTTSAITSEKRNTKRTGELSELDVMVALSNAGYIVSKPHGENARYDLVADDGIRLSRVQVKTGRIRGGDILFNSCSTHGHGRTKSKVRPYRGQVEYLAVYCPDNGKVYLLPETDITASKGSLRLVLPKNNMVQTIRWAWKYELA